MTAFAALRALGWMRPVPVEPPRRLSDPTGDAITHHLIDRGLWRYGAGMSLTSQPGRLCVRVFLPEHQQNDRSIGSGEAKAMRLALVEAMQIEGFTVLFSDAVFCERGQKGWDVVARAARRG